ncbi:phosphoribosylformylglycinamidine synthase subunit PurS [Geodermatophilus dictyosporus]|uniref:phosphoribosylformylglycinamidine synthase subunit PurS n=1 Tax=Geodermatophilus dictyosporus TaxID=1523247 RepID=UPI000B89CD33|nr:phosphoribosylformylglycinamidine synthase subunit PurS [Geodermatophilus dictyosporus]
MVRSSRDTYLPRAVAGVLAARIEAVLMTAPEQAVVSHATAAELWALAVPLRREDLRVHLTVATGSAVRGRRDRVVHRTPLGDGDTTTRDGVRVTTPRRTWRDLAAVLEPAALLAVTDQVLARWCSRPDLQAEVDHRPTGRGSARARAVLPVADPRAESPMESVLRWLAHEAGLPAPEPQHVVRDGAGGFLGRADLAWPDRRLLVEFDGDGHRERDVFVDDLRRQNRLVSAGWTVLRSTSADVLGRPQEVVGEIRRALARRDLHTGGPPGAEDDHCADPALGTGTDARREVTPATPVRWGTVPQVVVDVVLKPEISDPQGQAVLGALGRLGHTQVTGVRQGKHFVLDVEGTVDEADLKQIAETLLANPVIEDVELHLPTD